MPFRVERGILPHASHHTGDRPAQARQGPPAAWNEGDQGHRGARARRGHRLRGAAQGRRAAQDDGGARSGRSRGHGGGVALRYLADKSALARLRHPTVAARLAPLLVGGDVATCSVVDLEILFSARTHADLVAVRAERRAFTPVPMAQEDFDRALDVLDGLARTGHHRAAGLPDLLIAAAAERHGLTVLHYDRDCDLIAKVTRQPMEWIVAAGTVP